VQAGVWSSRPGLGLLAFGRDLHCETLEQTIYISPSVLQSSLERRLRRPTIIVFHNTTATTTAKEGKPAGRQR
jgi:hypothetical protein